MSIHNIVWTGNNCDQIGKQHLLLRQILNEYLHIYICYVAILYDMFTEFSNWKNDH